MKLEIKQFDAPEETRTFEKGRFEVVRVGDMTLGRATYEPGWKWSEHVGPTVGEAFCNVEHVGMVVSGQVAISMEDGEEVIVGPGDLFYVPPGPPGHDSWVVGDEPYVSLHFLGAHEYADKE